MGIRLKNKRLHILAIFYIAVLAILFQLLYPETPVAAAITVIAIVGYVLALATDIIIRKSAGSEREGNDE